MTLIKTVLNFVTVVAACCTCCVGNAGINPSAPVIHTVADHPPAFTTVVAQNYPRHNQPDDKEANRYRPPPPPPQPSYGQHPSEPPPRHSDHRPPRSSQDEPAVWVPGRWERLRGTDEWVPGHWERRNNYR